MTKIKIDDKEYDYDKLSDKGNAQLASMQFCDQKLQRLQAQAANDLVINLTGLSGTLAAADLTFTA
jgi:hypothetical protein